MSPLGSCDPSWRSLHRLGLAGGAGQSIPAPRHSGATASDFHRLPRPTRTEIPYRGAPLVAIPRRLSITRMHRRVTIPPTLDVEHAGYCCTNWRQGGSSFSLNGWCGDVAVQDPDELPGPKSGRVQPAVATPGCRSERSCSRNTSAGVFQSRLLRGLLLSARATASRSSADHRERSVPLGK